MNDQKLIDFGKIYGFENIGLEDGDVADLKGSLASSRLGAKIGFGGAEISVTTSSISIPDDGSSVQGNVACDAASNIVFQISNDGDDTLFITGQSIVDGDNTAGVPAISTPAPGSIGQGESSDITVTFTPETTGPFNFELLIQNDSSTASEREYSITVSGNAQCDAPVDATSGNPATPNALNRLASVPTGYLNGRLSPVELAAPAQISNQEYIGGKIGAGFAISEVNTEAGNESLAVAGNHQHANGLYGSWSDIEIGRNSSGQVPDNNYVQLGLGVDRTLSANSLIGVMFDAQILNGTGLDDGATSRTTAAAIGPYFAYRASTALTIDTSFLIGQATHELEDGTGEKASVSESYQQFSARVSAWSDFGNWALGRDLGVSYRSNDREAYDLGATSVDAVESEFGTTTLGLNARYSPIASLGGLEPNVGLDIYSSWGDSIDSNLSAGLEFGVIKAFGNGGQLNVSVGSRGLGEDTARSDFAGLDFQIKF